MTKSITQSGLLAELLEHQRRKVIELAQRRAHRKQVRAILWSILTWPWPVLKAGRRSRQVAWNRSHHTELRQQIHDELRIQHPKWVEANGESSMCLMEELDTLTRLSTNQLNSSRLRTRGIFRHHLQSLETPAKLNQPQPREYRGIAVPPRAV
jgi:hypothetical protein